MSDQLNNRVSLEEHVHHLAEVLEVFYDEHGDYDEWTDQETKWHDLLLARVNREDGYS